MPCKSPPLTLDASELRRLEQRSVAGSTPQQVVLRCRIVLLACQGEPALRIAGSLKIQRRTVLLWRNRVAQHGIGTVWDIAPGRGRKPHYDSSRVAQIVETTLQNKPSGATHWSTRSMAKAQGISKSTVQRIWDDHQLKPHRIRSFKLSRDPRFVEKRTDVVGVYLPPPRRMRSSSASMKRARFRPWIALSPGYRSSPADVELSPTTTNATERPRFLRHSKSPRGA